MGTGVAYAENLGVHYSHALRECHAHAGHIFIPFCAPESLPPIPPISFTFGQEFYGGSAVKCRSMCRSKCSEDDT